MERCLPPYFTYTPLRKATPMCHRYTSQPLIPTLDGSKLSFLSFFFFFFFFPASGAPALARPSSDNSVGAAAAMDPLADAAGGAAGSSWATVGATVISTDGRIVREKKQTQATHNISCSLWGKCREGQIGICTSYPPFQPLSCHYRGHVASVNDNVNRMARTHDPQKRMRQNPVSPESALGALRTSVRYHPPYRLCTEFFSTKNNRKPEQDFGSTSTRINICQPHLMHSDTLVQRGKQRKT